MGGRVLFTYHSGSQVLFEAVPEELVRSAVHSLRAACKAPPLGLADQVRQEIAAHPRPTTREATPGEKFDAARWPKLEKEGWKLLRINSNNSVYDDVVHYFGMSKGKDARPVVQLQSGYVRKCYCLRMIPPRQTLRYRVALMQTGQGKFYAVACDTDDAEEDIEASSKFVRWLTDWQEVEL